MLSAKSPEGGARIAPSGLILLSGKRDSNPRPSAWEANALPTELFPQFGVANMREFSEKSECSAQKKIPKQIVRGSYGSCKL